MSNPFADLEESPAIKTRKRLTTDQYFAREPLKRSKSARKEHTFQKNLAKMLTLAIAPPGVASAYGVMFFSVDHAARVSPQYGAARKARGVIKGIPDIHLYYAGRAYCLELKEGRGKTDGDQDDFADAADACGVQCGVAWTPEQAFSFLSLWQIPHRKVTF